MSMERNIEIDNTLLEGIGSGRGPDEIAAPFAVNSVVEIQGDDGVLPWIGHGGFAIELWPGVLTDFGPASVLNLGFARFCREARSGLESQVGIVRAAPSGA